MRQRIRRFGPLGIIVAVALSGPLLLHIVSPNGVHVTYDSYTYLGAAHNIAHGKGLTYPFGQIGAPLTLFPPLFPALLSGGYATGVDELSWSMWINELFLFLFLLAAGLGVYRSTNKSLPTALFGMALALLGIPTLIAYSSILSETVFFPALLAALFLLADHLRTRRLKSLLWAAAATSAALLTRYAAFSLLVSGCLLLAVWPGRTLMARVKVLAVYGATGAALSIVWAIRNVMTSSTVTGGDHYPLHNLTFAQVKSGLNVIWTWFGGERFPGRAGLALFVILGLVAMAAALLWSMSKGSRRTRGIVPVESIVFFTYALVHFAFLMAVDLFSSRTPPLNARILGPMYIALALGLLILGRALWEGSGTRTALLRIAMMSGLIATLIVVALQAKTFIPQRLTTKNRTSSTLEALGAALKPSMPSDRATAIYGSASGPTWYATGYEVSQLPPPCTGLDWIPSASYQEDLVNLGTSLQNSPRMVILISGQGSLRFGALQPQACRYSLSDLAANLGVAVTKRDAQSGVIILTSGGQPSG